MIIKISLLFCFYFLFNTVKAAYVDKALLVDPYFEINQHLDDPYKRKVPESAEQIISDLLKGTIDFLTFSLGKISKPISVLNAQLCFTNTLKQISEAIENSEDLKTLLGNISKRLLSDPTVTEIFDVNAIERLIKMFQVSIAISNKFINGNEEKFKKGFELFTKLIKWTMKEVSSMEPENFDEFLNEFLSDPPSIDYLLSNFMDRLENERELDPNLESNGPSTLETLIMIQDLKKSIDDSVSPNFDDISRYFDEALISDLKKHDPKQFKTVLKYSEYEIRKVHDYKMSFDYRVNTLSTIFKKSAPSVLEENLRNLVSYFESLKFPHLGIEYLLSKIFLETKFDFESRDIELISYLIQELLSKDSMIRRYVLCKEPYEYELLVDKVKMIIEILISVLRNFGSEAKIDKFLVSIHDFLFNESIGNIQEVIKKFSEIFEAASEKELILCLELGLTGEFPLMKEYVLNDLIGIKGDEFYSNPWLRNFTFESMEKLSTIGTASEKSISKDSDDSHSRDEVKEELERERERQIDNYFDTFHTLDYDDRSSLSLDFRSSQDTLRNDDNLNDDYDFFDLPLGYDNLNHYI